MLGAIAGDIIGSVYEHSPIRTKEFPLLHPACRFTDDTVMTVAVAEAAMTGGDYRSSCIAWGRRYPKAGYGRGFAKWLRASDPAPYGSRGNGSAMRVSPVGRLWQMRVKTTQRYAHLSHDSLIDTASTAMKSVLLMQVMPKQVGEMALLEAKAG